MAQITIQSTTVPNYTRGGTAATLKVYATGPFFDSDGVEHVPGQNGIYMSVPCTVAGTTVTIPAFTLPSTTDSSDDSVRYTAVLFDQQGGRVAPLMGGIEFFVSDINTTPTWAQVYTTNQATRRTMPDGFYTSPQTDFLLNLKQDASDELDAFVALDPQDDDILQRKGGVWETRTPAQVKVDLDLDNVDNTADADKPVSSATQTALDAKQNTLVASGVSQNIKTVNGISPLGTGDIDFKTINGEEITGTGDIEITGGGASVTGYALENSGHTKNLNLDSDTLVLDIAHFLSAMADDLQGGLLANAPVLDALTVDTASAVTLDFTPAGGSPAAVGFAYEAAEDAAFTTGIIYDTSGITVSHQMTGLNAFTEYHFRVAAVDADGNRGAWSNTMTATTSSLEAETLAGATLGGITDPSLITAINDCILSMKTSGAWAKCFGVWLMVGGTELAHRVNWKDPQALTASGYLTFSGGWTHSATGALPNGSTGYAETHNTPTQMGMTTTSGHMSYHSRTNSSGSPQKREMGSSVTVNNQIVARFDDNNFYALYGSGFPNVANTDSRGHYMVNRNGASNTEGWKNGVKVIDSAVAAALSTSTIWIGGVNEGLPAPFQPTDRECIGATSGQGLTGAEAASLASAIIAMNTTLGRNA